MSTTGNEFEQPGVNYPDREDAAGATGTPGAGDAVRPEQTSDAEQAAPEGAAATGPSEGALSGEPSHEAVGIGVVDAPDHHGSDQGRDTMSVSQAQRTAGGLGSEQEQRLPAMSQNNASDLDKVTGVVAQTRQDVGTEPLERIAQVLGQRLEQAGVDLPEGDIHELARQISTGDADRPESPGRDVAD